MRKLFVAGGLVLALTTSQSASAQDDVKKFQLVGPEVGIAGYIAEDTEGSIEKFGASINKNDFDNGVGLKLRVESNSNSETYGVFIKSLDDKFRVGTTYEFFDNGEQKSQTSKTRLTLGERFRINTGFVIGSDTQFHISDFGIGVSNKKFNYGGIVFLDSVNKIEKFGFNLGYNLGNGSIGIDVNRTLSVVPQSSISIPINYKSSGVNYNLNLGLKTGDIPEKSVGIGLSVKF